MLGHPLVNALVASANQHHAIEFRQSPRPLLPENLARRRKQHNRCSGCRKAALLISAGTAFRAHQRPDRLEYRLRLHHHPLASAKRPVVHGAMAVVREIAQVVHARFDQSSFARTPHDPIIERSPKEIGEDRYNVESHGCLSYRRNSRKGLPNARMRPILYTTPWTIFLYTNNHLRRP